MSTLALTEPRAQQTVAALRVGPWLLPAFVSTVAGLVSLRPALDPDFGWHLRAGEAILQNHSPSRTDVFSYTMAGRSWADFEWLWEAGLAALHRSMGNLGPITANALLSASIVLLVYGYLRARAAGSVFAAFGALAALLNLVPYADVRPGMAGPFFLGLFLLVFELARQSGNRRWLLLLIPAQLVWANTHGSYLQGVLLCAAYGLGSAWDQKRWKAAWHWVGLGCALIGISLLNPLGPGLLGFTLGASRMAWNRDHNGEWLAPNFHQPAFWPLLCTLLLLVALLTVRRERSLPKVQLLLLIGGSLGALQSTQFVPFFAVAAAPILAHVLESVVGQPVTLRLKPAHGVGFGTVLALLLLIAGRGLQPAAYQAAIEKEYPTAALAYIQSHELAGPIFNEFDWGSYMMSALPDVPVFVDGRTEMYGDSFLQTYMDVMTGHAPAKPLFDAYGIRLVLIRPDSALANELRQDPSWSESYRDEVASVFVPASGAGG